jgi:Na+-driven multidrug efflux pump
MDQSLVIWILIGLGLITANLPFVLERHLLLPPWQHQGEPARAGWLQLVVSVLFFAVLAGLTWAAFMFISGAFFVLTDVGSVLLYLLRVALVVVLVGALLWVPGRLNQGHSVNKPFGARLLEVLAMYVLVGVLGFAFETSIGNPFAKDWEFYAITLCLFLVMAYPGFVYCYLLRHRKPQAA